MICKEKNKHEEVSIREDYYDDTGERSSGRSFLREVRGPDLVKCNFKKKEPHLFHRRLSDLKVINKK